MWDGEKRLNLVRFRKTLSFNRKSGEDQDIGKRKTALSTTFCPTFRVNDLVNSKGLKVLNLAV